MLTAEVLPLAVLAPVAGAVLAPLLARFSARLALATALLAVVASVAVLAACALTARGRTVYLGGWRPIGIAYVTDAFGLTMALTAAVVGALAMLATLSGLADLGPRELGGYACLSLLLIAAVVAGSLTVDLLHLFVWFEVAGLASYALTGFFLERPHAVEATFKVVVLTSVAGFLIFIGTALLYQSHGAVAMSALFPGRPGVLDRIAAGLLLAGLATKAGLVPFSGWLPDAHTAAPGPISALFSGILVNFGVIGIARLLDAGMPGHGALMALGCASALIGAAAAAVQDDLKRLLAYDTISQIGIVTTGLAAASAAGTRAAVYHLVGHALFKALLFLIAGAVVHNTGATSLPELSGLFRRSRTLVLLFLVGAAAIAGVPPLNGYVSLSLLHTALRPTPAALAAVLAAQVVTVAALTRVVRAMFARTEDPRFARDEHLRPGLTAALATLAAACFATGVAFHWVSGAPWTDAIELVSTGASVALGVVLSAWVGPRADGLRGRFARLATGSVNDYTLYQALGLLAVCAALLA
ncbi:complex I subunit 5 family protein [Dactylosporangium sp. CA-139114]|uniref:complex I subunit 5 family protein n=1 Tax=Dactylosporangium sp. CA-139114 TaxID=3239931 RepID=UPI003D97A3EA